MYHYNLPHNGSFHYKGSITKLLGEDSGKWEAIALPSPKVSIKYFIISYGIFHPSLVPPGSTPNPSSYYRVCYTPLCFHVSWLQSRLWITAFFVFFFFTLITTNLLKSVNGFNLQIKVIYLTVKKWYFNSGNSDFKLYIPITIIPWYLHLFIHSSETINILNSKNQHLQSS